MKQKIKNIVRPFYHGVKLLLRLRILKTIYINFRLLPLKTAIKLPIIIIGKTKLISLRGNAEINDKVRFGLIQIGKDIDSMPISFTPSRIEINGLIKFKGNFILNQGSNITVERAADLTIGNHVMIGSGVVVKAMEKIEIGNYTRIASGCFVFDSNMHSVRNILTGEIKKKSNPIAIGDYCWLTMYTSIMPGTKIPNYCITSRYSFLNKDYTIDTPPGSMLVGSPAKKVVNNIQRLYDYDYEKKIHDFFKNNPKELFFIGDKGFVEELRGAIQSEFKLF
jgi:acetyltransferase-like isoleucine patch superfamily enzyme